MSAAILVVMYVVAIAAIVDAARWSPATWVSADRLRSWWLTNLVIGLLFVPWGFVCAIAYVIGVRSRLSTAPSLSATFTKSSLRRPRASLHDRDASDCREEKEHEKRY